MVEVKEILAELKREDAMQSTPSLLDSGGQNGLAGTVSHWKRSTVQDKIVAHKLSLLAAENEVKLLRKRTFQLDELLNTTSPIMSSLSLDTLTYIFVAACEDNARDSIPSQFLIGGVCRAWRRIAWSIPQLWSKVSIFFVKEKFDRQEILFRDWVARAGGYPLHMHINHCYGWEPPVAFFTQILESCTRWTTFEYSQSSVNFQLALDLEPKREFPLLKSVEVSGMPTTSHHDLNKWKFNSPPQLRSLILLAQRQFALDINWRSLNALTATLNLEQSLNVIARSCSLTTVSLTILGLNRRVILSPNQNIKLPLPLQRLTALAIEGPADSVGSLLQFVTAPALTGLSLAFCEGSTNSSWVHDLSEFITRSKFKLTILKLQTTIANQHEIMEVLRKMPSIEQLDLHCDLPFQLSNAAICQLNPKLVGGRASDGNCLFPNLVVFKYRGHICFQLEALWSMIEGRFKFFELRNDYRRAQAKTSVSNPSNSGPSTVDLHIEITYSNKAWYRDQHPNALHTFYTDIGSYSAKGLTLVLEWEAL